MQAVFSILYGHSLVIIIIIIIIIIIVVIIISDIVIKFKFRKLSESLMWLQKLVCDV